MQQPADDDSTIALKKPLQPARRLPWVPLWTIAVPALFVVLAMAGGWLLFKPSAPELANRIALQQPLSPAAVEKPEPAKPDADQIPPRASAEALTAAAPLSGSTTAGITPDASRGFAVLAPRDFRIETATEQHVLDHETSHGVTVFRFKANPRILVLDFASLREQGLMLNRAAALVEKTGLPRNRLLSDSELDTAIRAAGDTADTYYYGHDYGAPALVRFFTLADKENIPLTDEEEMLRGLLRQDDWFEPNTRAGLISIPQVGANEHVTREARATILHHELSHGEYFTRPAYAAFVHRFWKQTLTEAERQQIRNHLRSLGYDASQDDLMENEAQAYLMFTDDAEFFTPDMVGMTKGRLAELRNGFYRTMPLGWLRDSLGATLGLNKTVTAHP
jgi:hypothetical protein